LANTKTSEVFGKYCLPSPAFRPFLPKTKHKTFKATLFLDKSSEIIHSGTFTNTNLICRKTAITKN